MMRGDVIAAALRCLQGSSGEGLCVSKRFTTGWVGLQPSSMNLWLGSSFQVVQHENRRFVLGFAQSGRGEGGDAF